MIQLFLLQLAVITFGQSPNLVFTSTNLIAGKNPVPERAVIPENIDWVYYFSNAFYSKWIPGENVIPFLNSDVSLKQKFGTATSSQEPTTGTDTNNINKIFIDGPNYAQCKYYAFTNKYLSKEMIHYTAVFKLKKLGETGPGNEVAKVQAVAKVALSGTDTEIILAERIVTKEMLASDFVNISLDYSYATLFAKPYNRSGISTEPVTLMPAGSLEDSNISEDPRIQFRVIWLGNAEIAVKEIEVYDNKLWKYYFVDNTAIRDLILENYLQRLNDFPPNGNYFITLDAPRSLDNYYAITALQSVLDSFNSPVKYITRFYWEEYNENTKNFYTDNSYSYDVQP